MHHRIILTVLFLLLLSVYAFAESTISSELLKEIEKQYPKAYIIKKEDFAPHIAKYDKNLQTLISGDFDCNSMKDNALQIYHNNAIKLIAIHNFKNSKYEIIEVSQHPEVTIESFKGHYEDPIYLRRKGENVEFYCDCDDENKEELELCRKYAVDKSPKGCRIELECDAIEWIYDEKAAELFYFDKEKNRYRSVITAD